MPGLKELLLLTVGPLTPVDLDVTWREFSQELGASTTEGHNPAIPEGAPKHSPGDNSNPGYFYVIRAVAPKCVETRRSGAREIRVWRSGEVAGELLYVVDAAYGTAFAAERFTKANPANLGSGDEEVRIQDLPELVCEPTVFTGWIRWDRTRRDERQRWILDTSRAKRKLGFEAQTSLRDGLRKTIEWLQGEFEGDGSEKRLPASSER